MANTASVGISEERFNELCFLLLVRRQMQEGLSPINGKDIFDWRQFVSVGRDTDSVKMTISAIWLMVIRFSKIPVDFHPNVEIFPKLVHQMCRDYLLYQKRKQVLPFGEEHSKDWDLIKKFLDSNSCRFSNSELEAARVKFVQDWFDGQVVDFTTNLTPVR